MQWLAQACGLVRTACCDEQMLDRSCVVPQHASVPNSEATTLEDDDFVAPVLELIVKDKYVWLPLEHIKSVQLSPPRQLRDMIWASAHVEASDGTIGEVFMPTLYAGTSSATDDQVRLGRMTDWRELGENLYWGLGLRLFLVDGEDKTLFEATPVEFNVSEPKAEPAGTAS